MMILGLAGSNVAYIGMVLNKLTAVNSLVYHDQYQQYKNKNNDEFDYCHDMTRKDADIKVSFDDSQELIVLNWQIKFRFRPGSEKDAEYGKKWEKDQKEYWKTYNENWEVRSILHWTYSLINDPTLRSWKDNPEKNFNGPSLYDGFDSARLEFSKFNITYTKQSYDMWRESQQFVFECWNKIKYVSTMRDVELLENDVLKGVALGILAKKNNLSEEDTWKLYIK